MTAPDEGVAVGEPAVGEVHRVAIRYLGLGRTRLEALRDGVSRRGWLPIVILRGDGDWDRSRATDYDQAFLSGETRHLIDIDRDRGDAYGVSLTLSWDLGDIAYEPESIDVSHETREVIELRDDVLDEITQLLESRADLSLLVVGHTDNQGGYEHNTDLSQRRAEAVATALADRGIDTGRLRAAGVGFLAPVATNDTEQGRALNRRVVLVKQ